MTVLVVDDGGYGMLRYDQDRAGDEHRGVDLFRPDFAALAASFGIPASVLGDVAEAGAGAHRRPRLARAADGRAAARAHPAAHDVPALARLTSWRPETGQNLLGNWAMMPSLSMSAIRSMCCSAWP